MPGYVAAAVGAAVLAAGSSVAVATAVGLLAYAATAMALSFAFSALMGAVFRPSKPNSFASEAQGRTQIVRSNVQPHNIIYGRVMTSGPLIFAASTANGGKDDAYMHLIVAFAAHECDAIEEIYLGNDPVGPLDEYGQPTSGKFVKRWGDSKQESFPITMGAHDSYTLDVGASVKLWNVSAAVATWDVFQEVDGQTRQQSQNLQFDFTGGGHTVNVYGVPFEATNINISFEDTAQYRYVQIKKHLGSPDQEADADLIAAVPQLWTPAHRLQGICYVYVRLEYDADIFPQGLPNIKGLVRGKRLYDPRNGTTTWTQNWALACYDYLRAEEGFGCTDADIDVDSVITAANISDEQVAIGGGQYQTRYHANGLLTSDESPRDNLGKIITGGAGAVVVTGGIFRVCAGAYDIPTITLTESDLRGAVKVSPRISRRDLFNNVKGTFVDQNGFWQPADFPAVTNPLYVEQDGGEVINRDVQLPFTIDYIMAQRLAKIILERSRQGISVEFPAKIGALRLRAYDTVKVTLEKFGWNEKVFRVMNWKMTDDAGIDLTLNEEAPEVYEWNIGNVTPIDPAPDTNLPDPFAVEMVGPLTLASGTEYLVVSPSGIISRIFVTWPAAVNATLGQTGRIEIQYRRLDIQADWTPLPQMSASSESVFISPVEDGIPYQVRARYVSSLGVRSPDWTYSPVHTVVGKLSPPVDMTNFSLNVINGFAHLTWSPSTEIDVINGGRARIRHTSNVDNPNWGDAIDIGGYIAGSANSAQLPLIAGTYLGKWVDAVGNESVNPVIVITTAPSLLNLNVIQVIQEDPDFPGVKESMVLDPELGGIKLIGNGLIDDQGLIDASGLWDSMGAVDGLGPIDEVVGVGGWGYIDSLGGIVNIGTYYFEDIFDLGRVEKSRLTALIGSVAFDTGDSIDDRFDMIDDWLSIDGDEINDTSVTLFVSTTEDDPDDSSATWTDWSSFSIGDYEARGFRFKIVVTSASATHNVVVRELRVTVDMPDRRESGLNVTSGAGVYHVTFTKPFRIVPVLGVTAQNMAQGDYFVITNKLASGFDITFRNSASAAVSRVFDWDAVAY